MAAGISSNNSNVYKMRIADRRKRDRRRMIVYVAVDRRKPNNDRRSGIDRRALASKAYREGQYIVEIANSKGPIEATNRMVAYYRLIDTFEDGSRRLESAVDGLTRHEALAKPSIGRWTIQEIVIHLADMDAIALGQMKQIIAEDNPHLKRTNQDAFTDKLRPNAQDLNDAVALCVLGRRQFARVLRELKEADFVRTGAYIGETGLVTLAEFLKKTASHLETHLMRISAIRKRMSDKIRN